MRKMLIGAAVGVLLSMPAAPGSAGHGGPHPVDFDPREGERAHAVDSVSITFDELLDPNPDSYDLEVVVCGEDDTEGDPRLEEDGRTISVDVAGKDPGTYVARYRVSGLADTAGEPTEGSYRFSLHTEDCERDHDGGHDKPGKDDDHGSHGNGNKKGGHHTRHGDGSSGGDGGHNDHGNGSGTSTHTEHNSSGGNHSTSGDHDGGGHKGGGGKHPSKDGHGDKHWGKGKGGKDHGGGHAGNGKHGNDRNKSGPSAAPRRATRPNDLLNLLLVLLIPAVVGALGGRALRTRSAPSAS